MDFGGGIQAGFFCSGEELIRQLVGVSVKAPFSEGDQGFGVIWITLNFACCNEGFVFQVEIDVGSFRVEGDQALSASRIELCPTCLSRGDGSF